MSRRTPIKHQTYLECIDQIPPAYCRLVARDKTRLSWHRMLTIQEIAAAAGLTWQKTAAIARRKSFAGVTIEDADKYRKGCGITFANEKRHKAFIVRNFGRLKSFDRYFNVAKQARGKYGAGFLKRILKRL